MDSHSLKTARKLNEFRASTESDSEFLKVVIKEFHWSMSRAKEELKQVKHREQLSLIDKLERIAYNQELYVRKLRDVLTRREETIKDLKRKQGNEYGLDTDFE